MKKLLLTFTLLSSLIMFSQVNCGVTHEYTQNEISKLLESRKGAITNKVLADPSPSNIQYLPLSVHFVRNNNGSYSKNASIDPFFQSVIETNRLLTGMGLQFYIEEVIYLDNTAWLTTFRGSADHVALLANKNPSTVNIWIVDGWTGDGSSGYGGPSGVELSDISEATTPHEFGHFLTLAHTFDTGSGVELVDGSNCATAGDEVCDTPADPGASAITITNCANASGKTDPNGDLYAPPVKNIMSYYGGFCGFEFTPGQFTKMIGGFNTWHTGYVANGEIATIPTGVSIINKDGYDQISWGNAVGERGTVVEYSIDNAATWNVMTGVLGTQNKALLSDIQIGTSYKLRLRHLNSKAYTSVVDYVPTVAHVLIPHTVKRASDILNAIGEFTIDNTTINNTSNTNDNYSLTAPAATPEMFVGGSYPVTMKIKTDSGGSGGNAFFLLYLDENADGDFDDAGELKYIHPNDNTLQFVVNTTLNIDATATNGFTRMRLRCVNQTSSESPEEFFNFSETEDYIVKLVAELAPTNLVGTFNNTTNEVELSWSDTTSLYKYKIERSLNGVDFVEVGVTVDGTTKSFNDTTAPSNSQIEYRVVKENGAKYSEGVIVNTGIYTSSYCPPLSTSGCGNGYGITKVSIASLSFENDSSGNCGITSSGYSDYYDSVTAMNLTAGSTYLFDLENGGYGGDTYFHVYLDNNMDGDFDDNGELLFSHDSQILISQASITVPLNAANGETRIRLRSYFNVIGDACVSASYGETEDYKVSISGGKESLVVDSKAINPTLNSIELNWGLAGGATPTGFVISISTDGVNFSQLTTLGPSGVSYVANSLLEGTKYYFNIVATGAQNSDPKTVWNTTTGTLGLEDYVQDSFGVYPNPTDGELFIKGDMSLIESIQIYNSLGQLVISEERDVDKIDISHLHSSMYYVKINTSSGSEIVRIIKN